MWSSACSPRDETEARVGTMVPGSSRAPSPSPSRSITYVSAVDLHRRGLSRDTPSDGVSRDLVRCVGVDGHEPPAGPFPSCGRTAVERDPPIAITTSWPRITDVSEQRRGRVPKEYQYRLHRLKNAYVREELRAVPANVREIAFEIEHTFSGCFTPPASARPPFSHPLQPQEPVMRREGSSLRERRSAGGGPGRLG